MKCDEEKLIQLARGELSGNEATEVDAHVAGCTACAQELAWAETELRLFRARTRPGVPLHAWQGIERRLVVARESRQHRRRVFAGLGAMGTLAAAAMTLLVWSHKPTTVAMVDAGVPNLNVAPPAATALDKAVAEYSKAIEVLDADWEARRPDVPPDRARRVDEERGRLRELMKENNLIAGDDVEGRRQALKTYSAYVRTVQAAVLEE